MDHLLTDFGGRKEHGHWFFPKLPYRKKPEQLREERKARNARIAAKRKAKESAAAAAAAAAAAEAESMPNGHHEAGGDGDAMQQDADASAAANGAPPTFQLSVPNGAPAEAHGEVEAPPAASQASVVEEGDEEEPPIQLDEWRESILWTMNLEKMQKKLYYDGYLSVGDFLNDLGKIIHNAEEAEEVEPDRMVRAHQMRNTAHILLDTYIEPGFRQDCEAMALRQKARDDKLKEATEKATPKTTVRRGSSRVQAPAPERHSSRIAGEQPEHRFPKDVNSLEREERKRSRNSQSEDSEAGKGKKARTQDEEEAQVAASLQAPPFAPNGVPPQGMPTVLQGANYAGSLPPSSGPWQPYQQGFAGVSAPLNFGPPPGQFNGHPNQFPGQPQQHQFQNGGMPPQWMSPQQLQQQQHHQHQQAMFPGNFNQPPQHAYMPPGMLGAPQQMHPHQQHLSPVQATSLPPPMPHPPQAMQPQQVQQVQRMATPAQATPEPSPEPAVRYPPFVLPENMVRWLQQALVEKTAALSIDELDQVRAACFDAIWRHRAEWNREAACKEIGQIVEEMVTMAQYATRERERQQQRQQPQQQLQGY